MIKELSQKIHANNKQKGFYDGPKNIGEMLALVHSEVSEALEADREDKYADVTDIVPATEVLSDRSFTEFFEEELKNTFEDELADIMIRVMDLAAYKDIDLEAHIQAKMRYNEQREHKHGKKY